MKREGIMAGGGRKALEVGERGEVQSTWEELAFDRSWALSLLKQEGGRWVRVEADL